MSTAARFLQQIFFATSLMFFIKFSFIRDSGYPCGLNPPKLEWNIFSKSKSHECGNVAERRQSVINGKTFSVTNESMCREITEAVLTVPTEITAQEISPLSKGVTGTDWLLLQHLIF